VELKLSCFNLPSLASFSKSSPVVVVHRVSSDGKQETIGRTEMVGDNDDPSFSTTVSLDWAPETELMFEVFHVESAEAERFIGDYQVILADLVAMGETPRQRLKAKNGDVLKNGCIVVRAQVLGDEARVTEIREAAGAYLSKIIEAENKECSLRVNPLAPPSLACIALLHAADLTATVKIKELRQSKSNDFLDPDITGPPLLNDAGFKLGHAHTIMRYLCQKHQLAHLYPTDLQARSKVDEALDHLMCRHRKGAGFMFHKYVDVHSDSKAVLEGRAWVEKNLVTLESQLTHPFVAGDTLTIADIAVYTEFAIAGLDLREQITAHLPKVLRWLQAMEAQSWHDAVLGKLLQLHKKKAEKS